MGLEEVTTEAIRELERYLLIEERDAKPILRRWLVSAWRSGFNLGRKEGLLDQHMFGGEG